MASGFLARQIASIDLPEGKRGPRRFEQEFARPTIKRAKLASLRPAFRKDRLGQVNAGNSP
jgi:hypothetical protein